MRKSLDSLGLRYENGALWVLDQRALPASENWIHAESVDQLVMLIQTLALRGAPLIGVAAAVGLAHFGAAARGMDELRKMAAQLREARPTAVNLALAIDRMMAGLERLDADLLFDRAWEIFGEDVEMCRAMGRHGQALVPDGAGVLTICNTGGLATVGIGTALGAIRSAHESGKKIHVYACETRPLLQGGRLTAWELKRLGIPFTLITDSMAATLMKQGRIAVCLTGADRIAANGDFANKIGTYSLAVLCRAHGIPFYPVAPLSTVDVRCPSGAAIPIEMREADEVRGFVSPGTRFSWAPAGCPVFNPAFDVTPVELTTGIVLNTGYQKASEFSVRAS